MAQWLPPPSEEAESSSRRDGRHLNFTFLRAWLVLRPQPRSAVLMTSVSAYSLFEKHWFSQVSPAGHTYRKRTNE